MSTINDKANPLRCSAGGSLCRFLIFREWPKLAGGWRPAYSMRIKSSVSSLLSARFSPCQLLKMAKTFFTVSSASGVA